MPSQPWADPEEAEWPTSPGQRSTRQAPGAQQTHQRESPGPRGTLCEAPEVPPKRAQGAPCLDGFPKTRGSSVKVSTGPSWEKLSKHTEGPTRLVIHSLGSRCLSPLPPLHVTTPATHTHTHTHQGPLLPLLLDTPFATSTLRNPFFRPEAVIPETPRAAIRCPRLSTARSLCHQTLLLPAPCQLSRGLAQERGGLQVAPSGKTERRRPVPTAGSENHPEAPSHKRLPRRTGPGGRASRPRGRRTVGFAPRIWINWKCKGPRRASLAGETGNASKSRARPVHTAAAKPSSAAHAAHPRARAPAPPPAAAPQTLHAERGI